MTLLCSDGYEYADLAQRILGRPLENERNRSVVSYRFHRAPEGLVRAFCEAYDKAVAPTSPYAAGITAACRWHSVNSQP